MDKVEYDFDFQINEKQCRKNGIRSTDTCLSAQDAFKTHWIILGQNIMIIIDFGGSLCLDIMMGN